MCRWFAYISPVEPCLLTDVLINPANAITKQVSEHYLPGLLPHGHEKDLGKSKDALIRLRNALLNYDGVGLAWYNHTASEYTSLMDGPRPTIYRSASAPKNDVNYNNICDNTQTRCLFAHVRASSGSAITATNSHPFQFGRHIFMHNGGISDFTMISRDLCNVLAFDAYANIRGTTDSEYAAALYITFLCGSEGTKKDWQKKYTLDQMKQALQKTVVTIMEIQQIALEDQAHANGLNFCVTDGEQMAACRFRNHATEEPSSLYWSEFAGRKLNRKYPGSPDGPRDNPVQVTDDGEKHGKHTIIASEPTTYDEKEWNLIKKNHMLLVDDKGVETEVPLEYDEGLNAAS